MEALISLFAVMAVIGSIIAVWLNTKSGKKWLKSIVYFSLEIEGIMDALGFSLATKSGWLVCAL